MLTISEIQENAGPANRPSSVKSKGSSNGVDSCIERLVKHLTENQ
jgi:hypothetical protein